MKFLQFSIVALLLLTTFMSCEKEKEDVPQMQPGEIPLPGVKPVEGKWMGSRYSFNKSIPVYFGLHIKSAGKLDILNPDKQVIGTGTWNYNNDVFTATYSIPTSGETYSLRSDFYNKLDRIAGTWGHDDNDANGGIWEMDKTN